MQKVASVLEEQVRLKVWVETLTAAQMKKAQVNLY